MANTNTEWVSRSDKSLVALIGDYIKHQRLIQNKTQATIAENAGINRWTLSKIENGEPSSLGFLILTVFVLIPYAKKYKILACILYLGGASV